MNRLHKKITISFLQKLYILFFLFIAYGWYKNGLLPYLNHFYSVSQLFLILLYPALGFGIGSLFDYLFKNQNPFNNKFYGLLFSLIVPISTNICVFVLLIAFLCFTNTFLITKKDLDLNVIVLGKLILVGILFGMHTYGYANLLEESHLFAYSYLDGIFGNTISGVFTSNVFLTLISFAFLCFDIYYKKEIPFYSYGIYLITLVFYAIFKNDMQFILKHLFSSDILFALIFIASLSPFSPYSKKRIALYSIFLGITILPFSILTNFWEGVYISLLLANFLIVFLNAIQIRLIQQKK